MFPLPSPAFAGSYCCQCFHKPVLEAFWKVSTDPQGITEDDVQTIMIFFGAGQHTSAWYFNTSSKAVDSSALPQANPCPEKVSHSAVDNLLFSCLGGPGFCDSLEQPLIEHGCLPDLDLDDSLHPARCPTPVTPLPTEFSID